MRAHNTLGFQISLGKNPTGFLVYTTQTWDDINKRLNNRQLEKVNGTLSHEFGHAVQMASARSLTGPNKTVNYYSLRGPHCSTGGHPGTCLMYGINHDARIHAFCTTTGADLFILEASKENDCTKAVRKIDLNEPFTPYR